MRRSPIARPDKSLDVVSYHRRLRSTRTTARSSSTSATEVHALRSQKDRAWAKDADDRQALVDAMRKGTSLVVQGTSARGTETTDTYSLMGFSKAYEAIGAACGPIADGDEHGRPLRDISFARHDRPRPADGATFELIGAATWSASIGRARRRDGGDRRAAVPRPPALALDLSSRRHRFRRMTTLAKDFRAAPGRALRRSRGRRSRSTSSRSTARANGCCASPTARKSRRVHIPEEDRGTLCVSSQVGCTLTCSFCHTGTQRLVRNLSAAEIVGQVMVARDALGEWPSPPDGRLHLQHRDDGHGRAALQFRQRREGAEDRHGRRGHRRSPSAGSRSRPPAWCR